MRITTGWSSSSAMSRSFSGNDIAYPVASTLPSSTPNYYNISLKLANNRFCSQMFSAEGEPTSCKQGLISPPNMS